TLDTSVLNVSIAKVAEDLGTTVTGIQTAITLYTLVMAMFMVTGGRLGALIGRRRAFALGCVVYGCGSLTTSLAPGLPVLIVGWSVLEGLGAVLIMPAIVALVAANFGRDQRPRAYGLIAAAGAMAVAVGPLVGGLVTTYFSWRWVFAAEVLLVLGILVFARRMAESAPERNPSLDLVGTVLSAAGLGLVVYAILRTSTWGWVLPKAGAPSLFGLSISLWLILAGLLVLRLFLGRQHHRIRRGREPLTDPALFGNAGLRTGLIVFFFQFLLQAGLFFVVPLFLSVALGLSALDTGVRLLPLSVALLAAAAGIPKVWPEVSPRRVVRLGLTTLLAALVILLAALELGAGPEITTVPMLLAGFGIGALASQLGSVTVSAVPDERTSEVGGLQNTATNLGASVGTALAGSVLIAALTTSFLQGIAQNPAVPPQVSAQAEVSLVSGATFLSDAALGNGLAAAGVPEPAAAAIVAENEKPRIQALRASIAVLALAAVLSIFFTRRIPAVQPGRSPA
ncbi:MFS transporter, partial [Amycolatopsis rhizosphaerae]